MVDPEVKKMLQAIINGQSSLRGDMVQRDEKREKQIEAFKEETKEAFKKVHKRLDMIGKSVAFLEDNLPAIAAR